LQFFHSFALQYVFLGLQLEKWYGVTAQKGDREYMHVHLHAHTHRYLRGSFLKLWQLIFGGPKMWKNRKWSVDVREHMSCTCKCYHL